VTYENIGAIADMLGATIREVTGAEVGSDRMRFVAEDGRTFVFVHRPDCCETVEVNDIAGDIADLIGSPLLMAEEVSNEPEPEGVEYWGETHTWTFYKFATVRGYVTVRWLGVSNGYYSESVCFEVVAGPA